MGSTVVSVVTSLQEGSGFSSRIGHGTFQCWVCVRVPLYAWGSSSFLPKSSVGLTVEAKAEVGQVYKKCTLGREAWLYNNITQIRVKSSWWLVKMSHLFVLLFIHSPSLIDDITLGVSFGNCSDVVPGWSSSLVSTYSEWSNVEYMIVVANQGLWQGEL